MRTVFIIQTLHNKIFLIVKFQSTLTSDYGETGTPRTITHGMGTKPDWVIN